MPSHAWPHSIILLSQSALPAPTKLWAATGSDWYTLGLAGSQHPLRSPSRHPRGMQKAGPLEYCWLWATRRCVDVSVCVCLCVCMGVVYICVCMCVHVYVCHSVCLCVHVCLDCEIIRHLTFSVKYKLEGPFCYSRIKSFQRERGKTADWDYSPSLLNSLSVFKSSSWKLGKVPETQESADS